MPDPTFLLAIPVYNEERYLIPVLARTRVHPVDVLVVDDGSTDGTPRILDALERNLKIQAGETSKDLQYTLETVNCVGACALGPVVVVDGESKGKLNPQRTERLLKEIEPEATPKKKAAKAKKKAPQRKADAKGTAKKRTAKKARR